MRRRAPAFRSAPGFTVVELLGMLALLGILLAIAAPKFDRVDFEMKGAVHDLGAALLAGQRLALTRGHDVVVAFDLPAAELRIHEDFDNDGAVDSGETIRRRPLGAYVVFGLGAAPPRAMGSAPVSFRKRQDALPAVTFHRNGSASEAGGLYLTSRRATLAGGHPEDTWAVEIERATGRPSWYRYVPPEWRRSF